LDCQKPLAWPLRTLALRAARAFTLVSACLGCSANLDAGSTRPHGKLPVDERNPIIITNDGAYDNWQGEYAVLLANSGGPPLAGIVVSASPSWPNIDDNMTGWTGFVTAARNSGLSGIPDPLLSPSSPLQRPTSGVISDTQPNRSMGAQFILDTAARLSLPYRPLVIATGGRLTDIADAYLVDPTVAERIVVVSSLGSTSASGASMGQPNGEMDPWADAIVASRLRYVQVSAFYDQLADVPDSRLSELPNNPLGIWMAAKQPKLYMLPQGSDQVGVLAIGLASFTRTIETISVAGELGPNANVGPNLVSDPRGAAWLVTKTTGSLAAARLWELLLPTSSGR
jgi:hypothetical protein